MPGSSPTMALRAPTRRLKRVDLPTLGRPTIAIVGAGRAGDDFSGSGCDLTGTPPFSHKPMSRMLLRIAERPACDEGTGSSVVHNLVPFLKCGILCHNVSRTV